MTSFYEEQFRAFIMQGMLEGGPGDLKTSFHQLLSENEKDFAVINRAYLNVKKEVVG